MKTNETKMVGELHEIDRDEATDKLIKNGSVTIVHPEFEKAKREMETKAEQVTFGTCKVCKINEGIYSRGVCSECHEKKCKVCRELDEKGLEPGTEEYIKGLKEAGVYY